MAVTAETTEIKPVKSRTDLRNSTDRESAEKKKLQEIGFFALCFFAPVLLMTVIWGSIGISYGGEVTPLTYDMQAQYMPFYASLRYILSGENSILFSWSFFMGSNFMGAYALDLASPLSWITVLWSLENMPDAIYVLTLLKIGLCGLSFAFFTRFGLSDGTGRRCGIVNVLFSCCYALMSYNVMHSICLPWLEEVILLPIILLGIEKLLQGKRGFLYFISIAAAFICNYYISYMVGIFAAVYILCRVLAETTIENRQKMLKALLKFGVNTLLALGISLPLLLPALQSLIWNMTEQEKNPPAGSYGFSFWQLLQKLMPGYYDSIENWGLPSIYCGSIMVFLAVAYFCLKKYSLREKLSYMILAAVPFAGFLWKEMDYVWHGFQYPTSVPYRYAFLFSAVILILAWKVYVFIPTREQLVKLLAVIGGCYLCLELFFNGVAIASGMHKELIYTSRQTHELVMDYTLPLVKEIREEEGFFRAEVMTNYMWHNEPVFYGLKGINCFHSAVNEGIRVFLYVMGSPFLYGRSTGEGLSPVGDSLLGVRYRITAQESLEGYEMKSISRGHWGEEVPISLYLQENKNALSLGYLVDEESILRERTFEQDVFENQNKILEAMGVREPEVFQKLNVRIEDKENIKAIIFTPLSDNPVYCYLVGDKQGVSYNEENEAWEMGTRGVDIRLKGKNLDINGSAALRCTQHLGTFEGNQQMTMEIDMDGGNMVFYDAYIYELNMEKYEAAMKELKEGELQITSTKGGHITGAVTAKQGQMLLLTLPVDTGYSVKVDGEKSTYVSVFGTFLGIPITEGEHQIEINYVPPYLKEGIVIGLSAFVIACLYFGMGKQRRKSEEVEIHSRKGHL